MKIVVGYEKNNVSGKMMEMALKHAQAKKYFDDAGGTCETHLLIRGFKTGEDLVMFAKRSEMLSG